MIPVTPEKTVAAVGGQQCCSAKQDDTITRGSRGSEEPHESQQSKLTKLTQEDAPASKHQQGDKKRMLAHAHAERACPTSPTCPKE
jgi:hypothetical protein